MVVIKIKRSENQGGFPTNKKLIKAFNECKDLMKIPHQFYFPDVVLKNLIVVKKAVLKNKEAYIKSGGGNKMTSAVIVVDGKSNSGKSTIASQIGLFFDPTMTLENNYAWNLDRLEYLAEHCYPGKIIIFDEAMVLNSRSANSAENLRMVITLAQIRSKGVFFIFCINSVHQLEKTIPLSRANFLIHVKRIGGISGIPKYVAYDEDRMKDLVIKNAGKYSYRGVMPNTDWMTFSRYFIFDDVLYDKMKHKESLKNVQKNKKSIRDEKLQLALGRLATYCKDNGLFKSYAEICDITGLPGASLSGYRKFARKKDG